jgi:hypothetical protein
MAESKLLASGEVLEIQGRGGWTYRLIGTEKGADIRISNPSGDGGEKFFAVDTAGHPYGAPTVYQEPTLGIATKTVKGVEIDGNIVGALVLGPEGTVTERFSWSNLVYIKRKSLTITADGELVIDGHSKGFLNLLLLPDKERLNGYVGVFAPAKPEKIRARELQDFLL